MGYVVQAPRVAELVGAVRPPPVPPGFAETQTPAGLSLVETIETSRGPWSSGSPYGRAIEFVYPAALEASSQLVFNVDRQPGPPRARTLHLFRSDASLVAGAELFPPTNADVYARVTYGIGGVQNQALFDWLRGGHVPITCDSLSVEAIQYAVSADSEYVPPEGFEILGCMLSHDGAPPPRPPTFTSQQITLQPATGVSFSVPDFARWCFPVYGTPATTLQAGQTVRCLNFGNLLLKETSLSQAVIADGFLIPGGTTQIEIDNDSGEEQTWLLQFQLGL